MAAEIARMTDANTGIGGVCTFTGLVRDMAGDTGIEAMTLEHYPGMTEQALAEVEAEARQRWPLDDVLIIHRHGRLEPGDRIVLVATAAAHRDAAFDACRFLIDWLKTRAPFWKLEQTAKGTDWVEAKASDDDAAAKWRED
jgi:molybdopterin synthase catalytic subunit